MMYKLDENWTWDKYFRQCGIYQGRSFWHDIKDLIVKLKNKVINK